MCDYLCDKYSENDILIQSSEDINAILLKDDPDFEYDDNRSECELENDDLYILMFYSFNKEDNVLCINIDPQLNGKRISKSHLLNSDPGIIKFLTLLKESFFYECNHKINLYTMLPNYDRNYRCTI